MISAVTSWSLRSAPAAAAAMCGPMSKDAPGARRGGHVRFIEGRSPRTGSNYVTQTCRSVYLRPRGKKLRRGKLARMVAGAPLALIGLLLFCASCTSVNPAPFEKFSTAVQQLQKGADESFATGAAWSETGYVAQVAADNTFQFNSLLLSRAGNTYTAQAQQPLYLEIRQARSALSSVNTLLVDYANLLVQLSSGDLVSESTFDQMAKDLNTNTTAVFADLSAVAKGPSAQEIGLFSTAAAEAARLYIEHKRQADLLKVINDNQGAIATLSQWCQDGLAHLATDLNTSYSNQTSVLGSKFGVLRPANAKNLSAREALIQQQLQLNENFSGTEDTISALQLSYTALPKAHADLAKAIEKPGTTLDGIESLYAEARRLQSLNQELMNNAKGSGAKSANAGGK